jgi:hypothetical protein
MSQLEDQEKLIAGLRELPAVKPSSDPVRAPALHVIDCVLSLNRRYDKFVVKRLDQFEHDHPAVRSISELHDLIASFPSAHQFVQTNLKYKHEERANTLAAVVNWLVTVSGRGSEQEQLSNLTHWASSAHPQDCTRLGIRGFGLAAFQYLRMLFGANTTKPDVHICRFVASHVGHQVSPVQALRLLEEAAPAVGICLGDLDRTIWQTKARKGAN